MPDLDQIVSSIEFYSTMLFNYDIALNYKTQLKYNRDKTYKSATPMKQNSNSNVWPIKKILNYCNDKHVEAVKCHYSKSLALKESGNNWLAFSMM